MIRVPTPSPPGHPGGIAHSDSEKAEALADNLETQFQPVIDPSFPAVIEMVDVALRSYFMTPEDEPKLTNTGYSRNQQGLKVNKAPGSNAIPNRALFHLPQRAVSLLVLLFNAILLTRHFPTACKHVRVNSIPKTRKDPALPSPYRPISLSDRIGKLFEKTLLDRILDEVSVRGQMWGEYFGFRPRHSTSLQLARLEGITRNVGEGANRSSLPRRGQSFRYRLDR